jgi:hypothetical protein
LKSLETNVGRVIVARVMPDEDLIDSIVIIVKKYDINAGLINVIGALKKFTIGYFNLKTKKYNFKTYEEDVELISCMGNISYKNEEPIVHLHVAVGRSDNSIIGGHLSQPSIISITGEIYIYEISQKIYRVNEPKFNLALLDL